MLKSVNFINSILATIVAITVIIPCHFTTVNTLAVASTNVNLDVTSSSVCPRQVKVYPEKRIPRTGNWGTNLTVQVYSLSNTIIGTLSAVSDSNGFATMDFCSLGFAFPEDDYNFYVRGFSHLNKKFLNFRAFNPLETEIDFTVGGAELSAGETSVVYDNKINSLDLSTQISAFYSTTDIKNDLNRDGKVNSLDFSNSIYNLYDIGECSPTDPLKTTNPPTIICSN